MDDSPRSAEPGDERTPDAQWRTQRGLESRERHEALRRGALREAANGEGTRRRPTTRVRRAIAVPAFEALADSVREYAIFYLNPHGIITFWGEGARLIKWWTCDEAEGAHLRLLYPDGGSEDGTAEEHLRHAAEHGEYNGEGSRVRRGGSTFWAHVTLTALRDEAGRLLGFSKVAHDVTARRAADALLRSAAESAESARAAAVAANAAKGGFLATISHEIRTPVHAILGYHQLLELGLEGPLTDGQREHLRRASASGRHLLTLIDEVLDFSQLDAGQREVSRAMFRVGDVVRESIDQVVPQASARGLSITDAASSYQAAMMAWGDLAAARQVLINLLSNAVKFTMPHEGEPGRIVVTAGTAMEPSEGAKLQGPGPWVYVRVEDTGVGIPPDRLDAMFEPFVQGDMSLTRQGGGTGLGLAISRRLARMMDGDVTARSEPGVGSSFFFWLPAAPLESMASGGIEEHGPGSSPSARSEGPDPTPAYLARTVNERPPGALRAIGDAILAEIEDILQRYVARLRRDPGTPNAHDLDTNLITDHFATFLADVSSTLTSMDAAAGDADRNLRDGTVIQRLIARRHGAQRAGLGWSTGEVRREFTVLREEIAAGVRRRAPGLMKGPVEARAQEIEQSLEAVDRFVLLAARTSVAAHAESQGRDEG